MSNAITVQHQKNHPVPRTGFVYDSQIRGFDASFWDTLAGAPSAVANNLRLNVATVASYTQFKFGVFQFSVNVPTTPSAGEAKQWGLLLPNAATIGAMYFEITGATFRAVTFDDDGTSQTTNLTWGGEGAQQVFEIEWEATYIIFKRAGTAVATHQTRVGTMPLPLYLRNADADNTDFAYIAAKDTAQYV